MVCLTEGASIKRINRLDIKGRHPSIDMRPTLGSLTRFADSRSLDTHLDPISDPSIVNGFPQLIL